MLTCAQCSHSNAMNSKFCEGCGASLADVAAKEREGDAIEAEGLLLQVKQAQTAMLLVAGVQLLSAVFLLMTNQIDTTIMVVMLGIGAGYVGLWAWCKSNPLAASIVGLVVFLSLHATEAIVDPSTIYKGLIVKIIVITILARAIGAGIKHREFVRERGLG